MKNRICLVMIVKNEIHVLERCFESVINHINSWVICDTGSTDGTQELIKSYFKKKNIEGNLYETEWKDFGHNRTEAFKKAEDYSKGKEIDYYFVMDADDELISDNNDIQLDLNNNVDSYFFNFKFGSTIFKRKQLFNSKLKWKYIGVLHEYAECEEKYITEDVVKNYYIKDNRDSSRNINNIKEKYLNDAKILLKGIKNEPNNKRYYFYLANSYFDAQEYEKAMVYYKMRIDMGGWIEEQYYSAYRYAISLFQIKDKLNIKDILIFFYFLKANNYCKDRLEALYWVLWYSNQIKKYKIGYKYGMIGYNNYKKNMIERVLFIDYDIHKYKFIYELYNLCYKCNDYNMVKKLGNELLELYNNDNNINLDIISIEKRLELLAIK